MRRRSQDHAIDPQMDVLELAVVRWAWMYLE